MVLSVISYNASCISSDKKNNSNSIKADNVL
jgi:hypothetical protein